MARKKLIRTELSNFSEFHDSKLQQEQEITYQKEKNLLLMATKQMTKKAIFKIKNAFNKTRD